MPEIPLETKALLAIAEQAAKKQIFLDANKGLNEVTEQYALSIQAFKEGWTPIRHSSKEARDRALAIYEKAQHNCGVAIRALEKSMLKPEKD